MKIAFVFPGQGSQYRGMGKTVYDKYEPAKKIYEKADKVTKRNITKMCFEGSDEELLSTINQQPTIHTSEVAILEAIKSEGIKPDMTAGFSLGEYAALVCANIIDFEDSVQLVSKRGKIIQETVPQGLGKMVAIIGLEREKVEEIVKETSKIALVECSNFNCPNNIIVSGYNSAVDRVIELAKEAGAKKVTPLKVSAPFHTSLLKEAGAKMAEELKKVEIRKPSITYLPNVTAEPFKETDDQIDILDKHIRYPVRREETVRKMVELGVDLIVEIGPSGTLTKNNKYTIDTIENANVKLMSVETAEDIKELKNFLENK
jgi:[acyl-carrier-protein] S-malonyltransferase